MSVVPLLKLALPSATLTWLKAALPSQTSATS